jgi:PadR family transcriptional regulator PadR
MFRKAKEPAELLQGTLDLLVLKAVSLGQMHGYGILQRIEQISGGGLIVEQGALYPALYRLERQGLLAAEWGASENNRRAKYYMLTSEGRTRLKEEQRSWSRLVDAIATALSAKANEV